MDAPGDRHVTPSPPSTERPLTGIVLRAAREQPTAGLSRRTLLRRGLATVVAVWLTETLAGSLSFVWSAAAKATPKIRIGTYRELLAANMGLPIDEGFPAYVEAAGAFIVLLDPSRQAWAPGTDLTGDGTLLNVRALSKRCPHLGCKPNPCVEDFWFHCPCHQSRYDRLGIKAAGEAFGPAPRGMDRFAVTVDGDGVLTIDTGKVVLGPLPVALGQPGLIPPRVANGCLK